MKSESKEQRDLFLDQISLNNTEWINEVSGFIRDRIPCGWKGTGEDIRHLVINAGISKPKHPNAWGAVIMTAVKYRGWLKKTGVAVPMKDKTSHARLTWQYVRQD